MSNQADSSRPELVEAMPAAAREFMQACKDRGLSLDYLPRTLPLADRLLAAVRAEIQQLAATKDPRAAELLDRNAASITAYLGEVIRRETGASWHEFDGRPMLDTGEHQADPLPIVKSLLESGSAREGDVAIASLKAYCELVCLMQRVWLEGTVLGTYESMAALRRAITPDARLAGTIVAQSQLAVKTAKLRFDESLDFSSESLEGVERIMSALHKRVRDAAPGQELTDTEIAELSKLWGIYAGEVIRRYYGGQWLLAEEVPDLELGGKRASPLAKVRKRIVDGPMENLKYYFTSIMKVLSSQ